MQIKPRKIQFNGKQWTVVIPPKWIKSNNIKKSNKILLITPNDSNVMIIVSKENYDHSPHLRDRIAYFCAEETI